MKSNIPKGFLAVLAVALVASMVLSLRIANRRAAETLQSDRAGRAGFAKFLSQVGWMRLLQYRGSMDTVTGQNAPVLARRYNQLTDLDPLFAKAYEEGALDICFEMPEESLRLIDKAMAVEKLNDWRIPSVGGFIASRRLNDRERALRYFEAAARQSGHPAYIDRAVLRLREEKAKGNPLQALTLWVDFYTGGPASDAETSGLPGPGVTDAYRNVPDSDRGYALNRISQLASEIIEEAGNSLKTETDAARKEALQRGVEQVQKLVRRAFGGRPICARCFRSYSAGDRFCAFDGSPVEPYGICPKDHETIVRGPYCHKCGAKVQ